MFTISWYIYYTCLVLVSYNSSRIHQNTQDGKQRDELIEVEHHKFPNNTFCSGAAFVAKRGGADEDDGWIIAYVHNEDSNTSQVNLLRIYDKNLFSFSFLAFL